MELTKQQAIEEHRKMWNWIADQLENGTELEVYMLKEEYCKENNFNIVNHCFCCEYDINHGFLCCDNCPLLWGTENFTKNYYCETGLGKDSESIKKELFDNGIASWTMANMFSIYGHYKEAAKIARQIANLPEKTF